MLVIDEFMLDEFGAEHISFKNLLKLMLKIDPN